MYLQIVASLIYYLFQMFVRRRTSSVRPSLLIFGIETNKFISCVVPGPSQWFFYFDEETVIARTHIGLVRWKFQNLPLPAAQEVRDSSGVTPCIVMKTDGFCTTKCRRFLPSTIDYDLFVKVKEPVRGTRYNTRDELIRATGQSIQNTNKYGRADGVRRLPNIWQKVIKGGGDYIKGT